MIEEILKEHTITFLGNKGRGKTVGTSIIANNIKDRDVLILDVVGAFTNGKLVKDAKYIIIDKHEISQKELVSILSKFKENSHLVLNLQYLTRKELVAFCEKLFKILAELGDVAVMVDEVGEIVSQQREFYCDEFERTVRVGRNYGVRPQIMITQRPQKVDKNVLALSDYYIIMGLSHNLDLEAVRNLIGWDANEFKDLRDQIKKLKVGECYVVKHDGTITKARFNMESDKLQPVAKKRDRISEFKAEEETAEETPQENGEN